MKLSDAPRFMHADELALEVARFTYRPGWRLSVFVDPWEGPCLYVEMTVPDGYDPTRTVDLRVRSLIPPLRTPDDVGHWLLWRLSQIELHEVREFLHRDGRPFSDPHDPVEPVYDAGLTRRQAAKEALPEPPPTASAMTSDRPERVEPARWYGLHDHGSGTERHAHSTLEFHEGAVAHSHKDVPVMTYDEWLRIDLGAQVLGARNPRTDHAA